jgi:tRNA A37 threonylcarbamoyladenosine synthetase subunit TsaC/SUA5/YrdC
MWQKALAVLWPAPLSVIYQAASLCPESLVAADGSVALRVPRLSPEDTWFYAVLNAIDYPLPTTSVNHSGEQPRRDWKSAIALVEEFQEIYIPPMCRTNQMSQTASDDQMLAQDSRPSTLIKIKTDGNFEILRMGLVNESIIYDVLTCTKVSDAQK